MPPGVAACAFDNDLEALARTREFFDFLPLSNREDPPTRATDDPAYGQRAGAKGARPLNTVSSGGSGGGMGGGCRDRDVTALNNIIPHDPTKAYDIKEIITKVRKGRVVSAIASPC